MQMYYFCSNSLQAYVGKFRYLKIRVIGAIFPKRFQKKDLVVILRNGQSVCSESWLKACGGGRHWTSLESSASDKVSCLLLNWIQPRPMVVSETSSSNVGHRGSLLSCYSEVPSVISDGWQVCLTLGIPVPNFLFIN